MQIQTSEGARSVASGGVGGAGLGLGIAGTALGLANGGLANILGNFANGSNCNVNRMSALEAENAMLKAEKYTDSVGTGVYAEINKKYNELASFIAEMDKKNAIAEAINAERLSCLTARVAVLEGLTKVVVPIANICPQPATATTGA